MTEPSEIPTGSSKTIATTPGDDPRTAPSVGALRSSTAWAPAGTASPENAATTHTAKISHRAPRTITTHLTGDRITPWPTRKSLKKVPRDAAATLTATLSRATQWTIGATVGQDKLTRYSRSATQRIRTGNCVYGRGRGPILLVASAVLLTGCASATPSGSPRPSGGQSVPATPTATASAGSSSSQGGGPSESARMICDIEVRSQVAAMLSLPNPPPTTSSWADQVYTCVYHLTAGPLTLSVQESADPAAARAYFDTSKQRFAADRQLSGLGEFAYAAPAGSVVVLKDNKTLRVDVTKLPSQFGRPPVLRTDLGSQLAAAIMGCWTGA